MRKGGNTNRCPPSAILWSRGRAIARQYNTDELDIRNLDHRGLVTGGQALIVRYEDAIHDRGAFPSQFSRGNGPYPHPTQRYVGARSMACGLRLSTVSSTRGFPPFIDAARSVSRYRRGLLPPTVHAET